MQREHQEGVFGPKAIEKPNTTNATLRSNYRTPCQYAWRYRNTRYEVEIQWDKYMYRRETNPKMRVPRLTWAAPPKRTMQTTVLQEEDKHDRGQTLINTYVRTQRCLGQAPENSHQSIQKLPSYLRKTAIIQSLQSHGNTNAAYSNPSDIPNETKR